MDITNEIIGDNETISDQDLRNLVQSDYDQDNMFNTLLTTVKEIHTITQTIILYDEKHKLGWNSTIIYWAHIMRIVDLYIESSTYKHKINLGYGYDVNYDIDNYVCNLCADMQGIKKHDFSNTENQIKYNRLIVLARMLYAIGQRIKNTDHVCTYEDCILSISLRLS